MKMEMKSLLLNVLTYSIELPVSRESSKQGST